METKWSTTNPRPAGLSRDELLEEWGLEALPLSSQAVEFTLPGWKTLRVSGKVLRSLLTIHKDAVWAWSLPEVDYDGTEVGPRPSQAIKAVAGTYLEITVRTPELPIPSVFHLVHDRYADGKHVRAMLPWEQADHIARYGKVPPIHRGNKA